MKNNTTEALLSKGQLVEIQKRVEKGDDTDAIARDYSIEGRDLRTIFNGQCRAHEKLVETLGLKSIRQTRSEKHERYLQKVLDDARARLQGVSQ
ncbi:MAG: hypothetical protein ACR2PG_08100 [Hyphomicrobiaceae bacterium]